MNERQLNIEYLESTCKSICEYLKSIFDRGTTDRACMTKLYDCVATICETICRPNSLGFSTLSI